jgi:hypothetical protein
MFLIYLFQELWEGQTAETEKIAIILPQVNEHIRNKRYRHAFYQPAVRQKTG